MTATATRSASITWPEYTAPLRHLIAEQQARHEHTIHTEQLRPGSGDQLGEAAAIAQLTGYTTRQVLRWRANNAIPHRALDRTAIALGWHPAALWPQHWTHTP